MFAVVGMSPGNSYFREETIRQLLKKVCASYERIGVFIPDVPAISTYIALGYPANRARRDKAIAQGNALRNRVQRSIEAEHLDPARIMIFNWEKDGIEGNPSYRASFEAIQELYNSNIDFKKDADDATAAVLNENEFKKVDVTSDRIQIGVHYLLSELAFMLFLPDFLNENEVGYVYHRPWPVFEKLIAGDYDGNQKDKVRFILLPPI